MEAATRVSIAIAVREETAAVEREKACVAVRIVASIQDHIIQLVLELGWHAQRPVGRAGPADPRAAHRTAAASQQAVFVAGVDARGNILNLVAVKIEATELELVGLALVAEAPETAR